MDLLFKLIIVTIGIGQVKVDSARIPRLSIAESSPSNYFYNNIDGNPGVYSFNYDVADDVTGNTQYRTENRLANGTVTGAYGYIDAFGKPQRFRYVADQAGYRVFRDTLFKPFVYGFQTTTLRPVDKIITTTEPSITWTRPKRPNRIKNRIDSNKVDFGKGTRRKYDLVGPPSQYVAYYIDK